MRAWNLVAIFYQESKINIFPYLEPTRVPETSWKTGNTFLGRKIPYGRDIYIYIYYIHERILSHQSKHSISHFFPRRVLYNETAIVGIQAGTQLDGRVARK